MLIHKFLINRWTKDFSFDAEPGAKVLSVQKQHGNIVVYASVSENTDHPRLEEHRFYVALTGSHTAVPDTAKYMGTFMFDQDRFVVHIFYEEPK